MNPMMMTAATPAPQLYEWRSYRREDVPAVHHMLIVVEQAEERFGLAGTLADLEWQYDDSWINPESDSLLAVTEAGEGAALARVFVNPDGKEELRAYLEMEVHPGHRDLSEFALNWLEARGRERLEADSRDLPRILRASAPDNLPHNVALYESHGYRRVRYFYRMRRDLRQPIPEAPLPAGLTLRPYTPDMESPLRDAFNDTFADHWGFEPVSAEDWRTFFIQHSSFRSDLSFLVMDGEHIAGYSRNTVSPEENEREGIRQGWVGQLGVRREHRQRGVASALLVASMRTFKAEGLDFATLGVDTENLTGALRIYERLGFVAVKRYIAFEKPA